jgi:short-subunit dehydrogenase
MVDVFEGKVTIITGGSRGIGRELAYQLADQGAWLSLAARGAARLESAAAQCRKRGGKAVAVPTDVGEPAQCQSLVAQTVKEYGRIDMLINNAGISAWGKVEEMQTPTVLEQIMKVNYLGSAYCTFYALPYLKQARGRIVGICSLAGKKGLPALSGYAASKHAMVGFFDALRVEVADYGVSVTIVYPDSVATGSDSSQSDASDQASASKSKTDGTMSAKACAQLVLRAAVQRRREVIATSRGKILLGLNFFMPGLVDRIARKTVEQSRLGMETLTQERGES